MFKKYLEIWNITYATAYVILSGLNALNMQSL